MANEQIQRYEMVSLTRCGDAWQELKADKEGDWVSYDDYLSVVNELREGQMHLAMELERKDEQIRKLREALKDLRIRYVEIFDGYVRKTYHERQNPDDDLLLSLFDTDAALKEGE